VVDLPFLRYSETDLLHVADQHFSFNKAAYPLRLTSFLLNILSNHIIHIQSLS
jgi:hypothetical protein